MLVVVVLNLALVAIARGSTIARARRALCPGVFTSQQELDDFLRSRKEEPGVVPPWDWTADEWRETLWPWR